MDNWFSAVKPVSTGPDWSTVTEFENKIAEFFGAPYCVGTDSCTSAIELCLRYVDAGVILCPINTYLSVPMLAKKLDICLSWHSDPWESRYTLTNWFLRKSPVIDAATLWVSNSYVKNSFTCISFQHQKHLSIGRAGCILTDNKEAAIELKRMSYDGREPGIPWREQNIKSMGYHYYMTPETAALGLQKLPEAIATPPRIWTSSDYPDLTQMDVFK